MTLGIVYYTSPSPNEEIIPDTIRALEKRIGKQHLRIKEYTLEQLGEQMLSREGHRGNSWELLDYGSIVVHVFTEEARKFYDLERLWADAELVDIRDIVIEEN